VKFLFNETEFVELKEIGGRKISFRGKPAGINTAIVVQPLAVLLSSLSLYSTQYVV